MMCLIASDSYLGGQELQKKPAVHCYHYISRVIIFLVFTARCYASAVLAMGLCLSVSVSHKS